MICEIVPTSLWAAGLGCLLGALGGEDKVPKPGSPALLTGRRPPGRGGRGALGTLRGRLRGGVWRRFQLQTPRHGGISSRLSSRMAADRVLGQASAQSGSPGEGANFSPLSRPPWAPCRSSGTVTGRGAGDGFAGRGQLISLLLTGQGAGQERGSSLHVAPEGPPGPGLFRPGVTEAGEWESRRPPSAARDGARGMRVAFKVSRNPSAAGGGWQCTRGFWGSGFSASLTAADFFTLGFNFVVAIRGTLRGCSQGWAGTGACPWPADPLGWARLGYPGASVTAGPAPAPGQRPGQPGFARHQHLVRRQPRALPSQGHRPPPPLPGLPSRSRLCSCKSGLWGDERFDEDSGTRARLGYLYLRFSLRCIPLAHSP